MLFRKDIDPRCAYCRKGNRINEREVVCLKRGIVQAQDHCRCFRYDPLRRRPPQPAVMHSSRLREEDFSI